jgi:hypothetical protein
MKRSEIILEGKERKYMIREEKQGRAAELIIRKKKVHGYKTNSTS